MFWTRLLMVHFETMTWSCSWSRPCHTHLLRGRWVGNIRPICKLSCSFTSAALVSKKAIVVVLDGNYIDGPAMTKLCYLVPMSLSLAQKRDLSIVASALDKMYRISIYLAFSSFIQTAKTVPVSWTWETILTWLCLLLSPLETGLWIHHVCQRMLDPKTTLARTHVLSLESNLLDSKLQLAVLAAPESRPLKSNVLLPSLTDETVLISLSNGLTCFL